LVETLTLFTFLIAAAVLSPAQTFTTLHNFSGLDGNDPYLMSLVQGTDGNLYGATFLGGAYSNGEVFKITPAGTISTIYSFCPSDCNGGSTPGAGLLAASDGNLYGTTWYGGANAGGVVYRITLSGTETVVYNFSNSGNPDGNLPQAAVTQGTDGNFYGTTGEFGASIYGTVDKITPAGVETTLQSFSGHNGAFPKAKLIEGTDGSFYGTTSGRGVGSDASSYGSIFKVTPAGQFKTLHAFAGYPVDGQGSYGGMVQGADGNLYGTTTGGGAYSAGTVFSISPDGSIYKVIHNFGRDGAYPYGDLIQGTDGKLYGTTSGRGANNGGTIFAITTSGTISTIHNFDAADGMLSYGGLVQATNGSFYGTTNVGGVNGDGTVYSISVGLGPFVKALPTSGKVGQAVRILGSNLTGATSVSFNGTPATFTVLSHSQITTMVPSGATTGNVQVTVPSGTLTSNVAFQVR
jgi:uncharacterized repeat protein (TIGR03803 family)